MRKEENGRAGKAPWSPVGLATGTMVSLGACILFLTLASFGIWAGWIDEALIGQLTVTSCVLGAFIGGVISARYSPGKTVLTGIAVGATMALLLYLIGNVVYGAVEIDENAAILILGCLCGGILAGTICGRHPMRKRREGERSRKRRRR